MARTRVDKAAVDALLHELRALEDDAVPPTVADLARRHRLDPMIVRRIAQSEDVDLPENDAIPDLVDDEADTGPLGQD